MLLTLLEKIVDCAFALIPRAKPPSEQMKQALLVAHRGVHDNKAGIFENTHQAFAWAMKLGCFGIELDVHSTADGILVVHHDPTLQRLWHHKAAINTLSFSELQNLAPQIPSLAEVVSRYGGSLHLFIELKVSLTNPQALLDILKPYQAVKDYHLLTLDPNLYNNLELVPQDALLLVANHNNLTQSCAISIAKGYGGVLGNYLLLSERYCQELRQAQQAVGVGFVNSKNSLYREVTRGIYWLFSDKAQRVMAYIKSAR